MQFLLDGLPSGALLIDGKGKILMLNQQAENFLGWPAATLIGQPAHEWLDCYSEELTAEPENCPIARTLVGENIASPGRMWLSCRGAMTKPVEYRCSRYSTGGGTGAILAFNDITRELVVEKDLRSLASIAEACPLAIVELNEDANLIHANPVMMSLMDRFGFGAGLHAAVLPENIEALTADCLARQSESGTIEVNVGDHCYEWKLVPVAGERIARGYGVDLTARKRMELALARAKLEAESATRAKSELLANMNHELRTPLNGVIGMAELLANSELTDDQHDCAETIQTCAASLMGVIEELLTMADLAGERSTAEPSVFDLGPCLQEVSESYRGLAQQKGLRFTLSIAPDLPARVRGDRTRLKQVLHRLLANALKFTAKGEIRVDVGGMVPSALRRTLRRRSSPRRLKVRFTSPSPTPASVSRRRSKRSSSSVSCRRMVRALEASAAPGSVWRWPKSWLKPWAERSVSTANRGKAVVFGSLCRCPPAVREIGRRGTPFSRHSSCQSFPLSL